jgi:hypothetical protein
VVFSLGGQPVEITVGHKEEDKFFVHENVLCASSRFFQSERRGEGKDVREKSIKVPEIGTKPFKVYIQWLYTGKLPVSRASASMIAEEYEALLECYHLAFFIRDPKFKNAVIDALIDRYNTKFNGRRVYPNVFLDLRVYNSILESAPVRKLIVDMYARKVSSTWLKKNYSHLPMNFMLDLAIEFLDQRPGERKLKANSHYHEAVVNR